jgi:hypothetical protein
LLRLPWVWLPLFGPIRVSTILASLVIALALWHRHAPVKGIVVVMAWLSAYEILFQASGAAVHGWSLSNLAWMSAAVGGWVALAFVMGIIPDWRLLLLVALVWLVWILAGFDSNSPTVAGTSGFPVRFSVFDEILNELTKTLLALSYLVGALTSHRMNRSTIAASRP